MKNSIFRDKIGLIHVFYITFLLIISPIANGFSQTFSPVAKNILDGYSSSASEDPFLDIFKFSINEETDSLGNTLLGPNDEPKLFARTDYGSEFRLENELEETFSIEVPAFVIENLAESEDEEYYPIIRNGFSVTSNDTNNEFASYEIDFSDLYDTFNGQTITPEMGFVKLNEPSGSGYKNLKAGDIIELFVEPTADFKASNYESLFFIDRPVATEPVVNDNIGNSSFSSNNNSTSNEQNNTIIVPPGEELVILPSGERVLYVKAVYVQAPASRFNPDQTVVPVAPDGDYSPGHYC